MSARPSTARPAAAIFALGIVAALLWHFYNRFWWPPDEGVYAYVAQRILAGDRIHLDLIDLHGGYGNFANALAFWLFGEDLLSLRYPLVAATLAQSAITFWLLRDRGTLAAFAAIIAVGSFSFIQFLNPSANWYALALFFVATLVLTRTDPRNARDLLLIGFLCGFCFVVRQLSGVILALGVLTFLLMRLPRATQSRGVAARALIVFLATGLTFYIVGKGNFFAIFGIGLWPFAILCIAFLRVNAETRDVLRISVFVGLGALLAAAPLAIYHAMQGALGAWLNDMFVTALLLNRQDFFALASYTDLFLLALVRVIAFSDPVVVLNGLFWITIIASVPLVGALALLHAARRGSDQIHALPVLSAFWAVVGVHYQIPIYLFFALPATFAALLWMVPRPAMALATISLSACAVIFQAGQPLSRGKIGTIEGRRVALDAESTLPRVSLIIERADNEIFSELIKRIEAEARPGEALMTLPMEPEINFITGRPTPVNYSGTLFGLQTPEDVEVSLALLREAAPIFVVHRRKDKYLTPLSAKLLAEIRMLAPPPATIGPFDLYRLPDQRADHQNSPPE